MFTSDHPVVREARRRRLAVAGGWTEVGKGYFVATGRRLTADGGQHGEPVLLAYQPYADAGHLSVLGPTEAYDVPELASAAAAMRVAVLGREAARG